MTININNEEVAQLIEKMIALTGETEVEAVQQALVERIQRLSKENRQKRLRHFMETEVWPKIRPECAGVPVSEAEEATLMGYGEFGV